MPTLRITRVAPAMFASAVLTALLLAGGCALEDSEPATRSDVFAQSGWSRSRYDGADRAAVSDAARYAVSQMFRVDGVRSSDAEIVSYPSESSQRGGTGRIRDEALGYQNRIRRQAVLRVSQRGTAVVAECRVTQQRLDTGDYRVLAPQNRFDEAPTRTPIEGEASVSTEQANAWTDVGRDRAAERQLLDIVDARLRRETQSTAPAPAP